MFAPGVVIFEKTRRWESILKRHFSGSPIQVRPCRLPAQVLEVAGKMPGSLVVIDLGAGAEQGLRLIAQVSSRHPGTTVFVMSPASLTDLEWPAREFGAAAFLPESISDAHFGQLCERQFASLTRPPQPQNFESPV